MNRVISKIRINKPFYNAGKQYGWVGPSAGLGIKASTLDGTGTLFVEVGTKKGVIYSIEKSEARKIAEQYDSFYNAMGTTLAVIPWTSFKAVGSNEAA